MQQLVAHKVGTFHLLPTVSSCMESGRHITHCHRITVSNATSVGHKPFLQTGRPLHFLWNGQEIRQKLLYHRRSGGPRLCPTKIKGTVSPPTVSTCR